MNEILKLLYTLLFAVVQYAAGGYVLSKLWLWFISSRFDVPVLSSTSCIGLMLVVNFFAINVKVSMMNSSSNDNNDSAVTYSALKSIAMVLVIYPLILCAAYAWHIVIK